MKKFFSGLALGVLAMLFLDFIDGPREENGRFQITKHGDYYTIKVDTATGESWMLTYLDNHWTKIKDFDPSSQSVKKKSSTQPKLDVQPVVEEKLDVQPTIKNSSSEKSNYEDLIPNPK